MLWGVTITLSGDLGVATLYWVVAPREVAYFECQKRFLVAVSAVFLQFFAGTS